MRALLSKPLCLACLLLSACGPSQEMSSIKHPSAAPSLNKAWVASGGVENSQSASTPQSPVHTPSVQAAAVVPPPPKPQAAGKFSSRKRHALLIGNSRYTRLPLANPVNDATDMAEALRRLDFEVTLLTDAGQADMEEAIRRFGEKLNKNAVGLFYYSGHGVQYHGENYLIPVDSIAAVSAPEHLRVKTVNADYVMGVMQAGLNVVILDACRDNPFRGFSRSVGGGLAQMSNADGTLIAYATSPNNTADDGSGRNSPYTNSLLKYMQMPGWSIESVLKKVRTEVKAQTGDRQTPWYESSIDGDFYFVEK